MIGSWTLRLDDAERDEQGGRARSAMPMIVDEPHAYCGAPPRREQDDRGHRLRRAA